MQPQLFHISTAAYRGTLLKDAFDCCCAALTRGGAAMFTRSTTGCRTLDGPSLVRAASLWPKLRWSKGSLSQMLPNERGQQRGPALASDFLLVYTWYIHGIYTTYIRYILALSKTYLLRKFELLSCYAMLCAGMYIQFFKLPWLPCKCAKIKDHWI